MTEALKPYIVSQRNRNEDRKLDVEIKWAVDTRSTPEQGHARDFGMCMPSHGCGEIHSGGIGKCCRIA